jgi:hypothetical protein
MSLREFIIELMSCHTDFDIDCEEIVENLLGDIRRDKLVEESNK